MSPRALLLLVLLAACSHVPASREVRPVADHHQHLFSPTIEAMLQSEGKAEFRSIDAPKLVAMLDEAGMQRAVVLSVAYMYGSASRTVENELDKVRAENDWTRAQVALHPRRLVGFCGVNPLRPYALEEIDRCAAIGLKGLKMHFGNSDVQLDDAEHVEQLRRVFRRADERRLAIAVHMRASISKKRPYGAEQARVFLEELMPLAPHIPVQIAHLAASGPGYDDPAGNAAMGFLAEAVARGDARTRNLWFDVSGIAHEKMEAEEAARFAARIREVGIAHIVYGSDAAIGEFVPKNAWASFQRLPLTPAEFAQIARNVAPYLR